jgi:serine/threonine-protein kinase
MNSEFPTQRNDLIGTVLLGRFRIVRELAKGGMGVVYLARSEGAGGFIKPYVVKLVLPEHADNQRFIDMFTREARILANLRHPGIVSVIEFDQHDDAYVMVLEYVRGHHLGQWAKYVRLKKRAVPIPILLQLMIEVLEALHYAHSMVHPDGTPMHIVHRDISPSNILLDEDGRARLLDFGVARMRGGTQEYHTQVKGFVGKLMYSAPELFAEGDATAQSDCYSCAVVLHEILIGRNVFRGENQAATLNRVLHHKPERIEPLRPDVPPGLDSVLQKALSKSPGERYADAREFAAALRQHQREPESEVRSRFAALLKEDFGRELAEMLGLESLADRDEAWRRLSHHHPVRRTGETELDSDALIEEDSIEAEEPAALTRRPRVRVGLAQQRAANDGTAVRSPHGTGSKLRKVQESGSLPRAVPPPPLPSNAPLSAAQSLALPTVTRPPPPVSAPYREPPRVRTVPAFVAGLMLAGMVVAAVVFALRRELPARSAAPQIRVVTEQSAEQVDDDEQPLTEAERQAQRELEGDSDEPDNTRRPNVERRTKAGPDPLSLTRAFRKQQGKVESCFTRHAVGVEGIPKTQLEFALAASGKVQSVQVLPATLASTPLGKCLEEIAAATHFPPQGRAVSFAIPITATANRPR